MLGRCFEIMVEDGSLEVLKLLSSVSSEIAQGEILQLQHEKEVETLEKTYLEIIGSKTSSLFAASMRVGGCINDKSKNEKEAFAGLKVLQKIEPQKNLQTQYADTYQIWKSNFKKP
mgnify:CR=1 FL=1